MKNKKSKISQKVYDKQIELVKPIFDDYFNEYYLKNKSVKSYSFYSMEDMSGYSVILEYENFRQYVNFYFAKGLFSDNLVNTCFELSSNGNKFLCHFVDILNAVDSDDLSFYTFSKCLVAEDIKNAVDDIMTATEKYYGDINNVAKSPKLTSKIYKAYTEDDYDLSFKRVEDATDYIYLLYGVDKKYDELLKQLKLDFKRGRLESGFPERAYRVLSGSNKGDIKKAQRSNQKKSKASTKTKIIIAIPFIVFAIVFAVLCAVALSRIDNIIYSECTARNQTLLIFVGLFLGALTGVGIFSFLPPEVYKLIAKGKSYDEVEQVLYANEAGTPLAYVTVVVSCLLIWVFFISVFGFCGFGFTENSVVYKEYAFSQKQVCSFENLQICEIEADANYKEYVETAYAFKLDDEWYDLGVPTDDEKQIIQKNIEYYNIQVSKAYSINDIEG